MGGVPVAVPPLRGYRKSLSHAAPVHRQGAGDRRPLRVFCLLHKSAEGKSQAIVEGLDICYYPLIESLAAPRRSSRYVLVCSTPYLEQRIDSMTPAEAERARLHMNPN